MSQSLDKLKLKADSFGLVRFIAAIIILLFHYNKLTGGLHTDSSLPWFPLLQLAYVHGGKLVELFFIISGFCFVTFYKQRIIEKKKTFISLLLHRLNRILPSYYLSTIMVIIVSLLSKSIIGKTLAFAGGDFLNWKRLVLNLFCLDFMNPINGVTWFLTVNILCYAYYYEVIKLSNIPIISNILVVFSVVLSSLCVVFTNNAVVNICRGIASFGVGEGIAELDNYLISDSIKQKKVAFFSTLVFFVSLFMVIFMEYIKKYIWLTEVFLIFPSFCLMITNSCFLSSILSSTCLKNLGKYSFAIYIYQTVSMSIQFFICELIDCGNWYSKINFIVSISFTILFGIGMYYTWELPIQEKIKKWRLD